jgi:hypothetical protein
MTSSRHHAVCLFALILSGSAVNHAVFGDDRDTGSRDSRRFVTVEAEAAIDRGLDWLAQRQQDDGSFGAITRYRHNPGVAGLCGMAFLASGSTPGRGPRGETISRTVDYVMSCARPSGYIVENDSDYYHGPMYGHGFATLFLAEVYGMTSRDDTRDALKRAVQLIIGSQNDQGGWRYTPESNEADISVTVCQVMALRAARNAGISVPKTTIDRSVEYVERSQNADGGFRYRLLEQAESKFARSAAALVALYTSGIHEGRVLDDGLNYMMQFVPGTPGSRHHDYYFYGQYYAVQAAWHAGGDYWRIWYPAVRDEIISQQYNEGSWSDPWIGSEYATAMALIVLQLPNNYLPIFER